MHNIHLFLLQQNMRVAGDGAGYSHMGGAIVGDANKDDLGLQTVENLARNLLFVLKQPSA